MKTIIMSQAENISRRLVEHGIHLRELDQQPYILGARSLLDQVSIIRDAVLPWSEMQVGFHTPITRLGVSDDDDQ